MQKRLKKQGYNWMYKRFYIPAVEGNGAEIYTKSQDSPESLLGEEIDWLILSEASRIDEKIYDMYLRARLGSRQGRVIIPTTPHGYNWMYKRFYIPAVEGNKEKKK